MYENENETHQNNEIWNTAPHDINGANVNAQNSSNQQNQTNTAWGGNYQYTPNYQQNNQQNSYMNNGAYNNPYSQTTPKKKKSGWPKVVAAGLVFGLLAGSTSYATNIFASRMNVGSSFISQPRVTLSTTDVLTDIKTTGVDQGQSVADVTANAMPSMVTISTMSVVEMETFFGMPQKYTESGAGTGIIVGQNDSELFIATNNHVIAGAEQLSVGFIDEKAVEATIKGTDEDADLAIIAVNLDDIPDETMDQIKIATIGDSDELVLGEQIVAIGNALGYGQSVTSGCVSAFDRELTFSDGFETFVSDELIQIDAAINAGNSGGALLNMKGELVGINEAKSSMTSMGDTVDNMGYAIPINKARPILEELMNDASREKYDEEEQGYLGVTCANVTKEYSEIYGLPEGVCFTSVTEGGPADEAGIKKGDIIVSFDGRKITSYEKLTDRLQYYKAGDEVNIVVLRAHEGEYIEQTITVTLGDKAILDKTISDSSTTP